MSGVPSLVRTSSQSLFTALIPCFSSPVQCTVFNMDLSFSVQCGSGLPFPAVAACGDPAAVSSAAAAITRATQTQAYSPSPPLSRLHSLERRNLERLDRIIGQENIMRKKLFSFLRFFQQILTNSSLFGFTSLSGA